MSYLGRLFVSTVILGGVLIAATTGSPSQSQSLWSEAALSGVPAVGGIADVNPALLISSVRLSRLLGSRGVNDKNDQIVRLDDLIMFTAEGAPYFVIAAGGFFGLGAQRLVVAQARSPCRANASFCAVRHPMR
jgi:hypothetical protein